MRAESLGERIRTKRILMGLTQEQLAEIMSVPKSTISYYENDKIDIKGSIIKELSVVLQTTPNYLLGIEETDPLIEGVSTILKKIKDEKIRTMLYAQIKAAADYA